MVWIDQTNGVGHNLDASNAGLSNKLHWIVEKIPEGHWVECPVTVGMSGGLYVDTSNVPHLQTHNLLLHKAVFRLGFGGLRFKEYGYSWHSLDWMAKLYNGKPATPEAVRFWVE